MNDIFQDIKNRPEIEALWDGGYEKIELNNPIYYLRCQASAQVSPLPKTRTNKWILSVACVCGCIIVVTGVFTFSPEARAFADKIIWQVKEWITPEKSNVNFSRTDNTTENFIVPDILPNSLHSDMSNITSLDEILKQNENAIVLADPKIEFLSGEKDAEGSLLLNYKMGEIVINTIQTAVSSHGNSVGFHFNGSMQKHQSIDGVIYYTFEDGELSVGSVLGDIEFVLGVRNIDESQVAQVLDAIVIHPQYRGGIDEYDY